MDDSCDLVIIGGGQAGIPLAQDLAAAGKQIVLVERKQLGGSCVNFGCTPTKAAIASARLAHMSRRGSDFGIGIANVTVDFGGRDDSCPAIALRCYASGEAARLSIERDGFESRTARHFRSVAQPGSALRSERRGR